MTHFVLVPGANHGGWWYEPLVDLLGRAGHTAHALTLAGLDPVDPGPPGVVNLDTHVEEVVAVLAAATGPVVLVGHSYGGSVITGAADARPDRVAALVHLDSFVPEDGDSCWSMTNDWQRSWYVDGAGVSGLAVEPLPFFDARTRPHPLGTLLQRSRLTGAWREVAVRCYVAASDPGWLAQSPFVPTAARLRAEPGWTVLEPPLTHNVLADGPDAVGEILLGLPGRVTPTP